MCAPSQKKTAASPLILARSFLFVAVAFTLINSQYQLATSDGLRSTDRDGPPITEKKGPLVAVNYVSAPGNFDKRDALRERCLPRIHRACGEFGATAGMTPTEACSIRFYVGQPVDPSEASYKPNNKELGVGFSELEVKIAERLIAEAEEHTDLVVLPLRDTYRDLTNKVLVMMKDGLQKGAKNVLKIDDDSCPEMSVILPAANEANANVALYAGYSMFQGTEYEEWKEDKHFAKYMSGPGYLISEALGLAIFATGMDRDREARDQSFGETKAVLFMLYGSHTEDRNMGKFYERAKAAHPELNFKREVIKGMIRSMKEVPPFSNSGASITEGGVSCGSHRAENCMACPQGSGKAWCHGDCVWSSSSEECKTRALEQSV